MTDMTTTAKSTGFGQRMRAARKAAGLTQTDAEFETRLQMDQPLWVDQSKISRMETGSISEDQAHPLDVATLAVVYGVKTSKLSKLAAERLESVRDLAITACRCTAHRFAAAA